MNTSDTRQGKVVCKVAEKCREAKPCAHFCWYAPTAKQLHTQREAHAERRP
jgi:hypothetical protein